MFGFGINNGPKAPHPDDDPPGLDFGEARAPHNPHQQLITKEQAEQRTAVQLVEAAGMSLPALMQTMNIIAERLELNAKNTALLNTALGEFKNDVMVPFKEELKYLRHVTGDKLNHVSTDLEKYVAKLDQVLWGALRAQGMSDAAIKAYRTEYGMTPETPRGDEIENHIREVEEMKATIVRLTNQNRRLIATPGGHTNWQTTPDGPVWNYEETCKCTVCVDYEGALQSVGLMP